MARIVRLHSTDSLALPLACGGRLSAMALRERPFVLIAINGPRGGDEGGVALTTKRARLLASWLVELADAAGRSPPPKAPSPPKVRRPRYAAHIPPLALFNRRAGARQDPPGTARAR